MHVLRTATRKDIPEMLNVINPAYRGDISRQGWTTEADFLDGDIRTDAADLEDLMARPGAAILLARNAHSELEGCVFLEKNGERLYLGMLSVLPNRQGKGIGKTLLQGAEDYAHQSGCHAIYMQVISLRDELIQWYLRHGYQLTGERKPFHSPSKFGVPKFPLEFVILEKQIDPAESEYQE